MTRRALRPLNAGRQQDQMVLKVYADQLAMVFTKIFNASLAQQVFPTCFKNSVINPILKNTHPPSLNDYRPVALKSVVIKSFERLVKHSLGLSLKL